VFRRAAGVNRAGVLLTGLVTGVVESTYYPFIYHPLEKTFAHDRIGEIKPGELDLAEDEKRRAPSGTNRTEDRWSSNSSEQQEWVTPSRESSIPCAQSYIG